MATHTDERRPFTAPDDGITIVRDASRTPRENDVHDPAFQGFLILWIGFTVAPILFGLDKFFDRLTDWSHYLAPVIADHSPVSAHATMLVIGGIEIVAGLVVLIRPRIGGYLVAAWLAGIIIDLVLLGDHYDVALRDFGLLLGALALARLATAYRPALLRASREP